MIMIIIIMIIMIIIVLVVVVIITINKSELLSNICNFANQIVLYSKCCTLCVFVVVAGLIVLLSLHVTVFPTLQGNLSDVEVDFRMFEKNIEPLKHRSCTSQGTGL